MPYHCRPIVRITNVLEVYVRSPMPHKIRADLSYSQNGIESMVIEARVKNEKWFLVSCIDLKFRV